MAASEFSKIAAYANAVEAEYVRSVLEENGVAAFIDGAAANTALSYVGSAIGGVKVFVRTGDVERARKIVENVDGESDAAAASWFCGSCEETIDGTFEICWACGRARADVERPFPATCDDEHFDSGFREDGEADTPIPDDSGYDTANPYASPMTSTAVTIPSDQRGEINPDAEAMLLRAWRASIIGVVFLPIILHMYSMYLLIRAAMTATTFSQDGNKRFCRAFIVNVLAGSAWGITIKLMVG